MKIGIMQPYFFPYIGYWQLMNLVDRYVIYSDVTFIKGGWINRNRIRINGNDSYINLPIRGASSNRLIRDVHVCLDSRELRKMEAKLQHAYRRAPFFDETFPEIMSMVRAGKPDGTLSEYLDPVIRMMASYLGIKTEFCSAPESTSSLHGEERVIAICKALDGDAYYNPIGGTSLYSGPHFRAQGLDLFFVEADPIRYKQFGDTFFPNLSIIDVLMFNGREETIRLLDSCHIYPADEIER